MKTNELQVVVTKLRGMPSHFSAIYSKVCNPSCHEPYMDKIVCRRRSEMCYSSLFTKINTVTFMTDPTKVLFSTMVKEIYIYIYILKKD